MMDQEIPCEPFLYLSQSIWHWELKGFSLYCFTLCEQSDPRGIYCDDIVTCSGSGKEYNQETQGLLIYLFLYWIAFRTVLLFTQNQIIETQGDIEFIHGTIL